MFYIPPKLGTQKKFTDLHASGNSRIARLHPNSACPHLSKFISEPLKTLQANKICCKSCNCRANQISPISKICFHPIQHICNFLAVSIVFAFHGNKLGFTMSFIIKSMQWAANCPIKWSIFCCRFFFLLLYM